MSDRNTPTIRVVRPIPFARRIRAAHAMLGIALGAVVPALATAQTPPLVSVRGVAYDSLRKAPLARALVFLAERGTSIVADGEGRFRFDSVPPGTYTFTAQHAAVDSIGLSGISARATITDGQREVHIAVPSFATLWRAMCGAARPPADSGFVYGTIRDARSQEPVADAVVDLTWVDVALSQSRTVATTPWRARTRSDSTGGYVACGVPLGVGLRVHAATDSASSGLIDLLPLELRVQRRDLQIGSVGDSGLTRTGTIAGLVTDTSGKPIADARIAIGERPELRSAADGRFTLRDVPIGTRQVEVLAIGMRPVTAVVDVVPGDTARITAVLHRVTTLDVVRVRASPRVRLMLSEFEQRRANGLGYVHDSTDIGSRGTMSSVFTEFPGVQVERGGSGSEFTLTMQTTGPGRCYPNLWIDGRQERDFDLLNALRPGEIAAVEVYPRAFTTPHRFLGRDPNCGAVVVWTKWAFS